MWELRGKAGGELLPPRRDRAGSSPGTLAPSSVKLTALLWRRMVSTSRTRLLGYLSTTLIRGHRSPAGVTAENLGGHTQAQMSLCHRRGKARAARSARRSGGTWGCRLSSCPPQPFLSPSPALGPPHGQRRVQPHTFPSPPQHGQCRLLHRSRSDLHRSCSGQGKPRPDAAADPAGSHPRRSQRIHPAQSHGGESVIGGGTPPEKGVNHGFRLLMSRPALSVETNPIPPHFLHAVFLCSPDK